VIDPKIRPLMYLSRDLDAVLAERALLVDRLAVADAKIRQISDAMMLEMRAGLAPFVNVTELIRKHFLANPIARMNADDLLAAGIPATRDHILQMMHRLKTVDGFLARVSRGVYKLADQLAPSTSTEAETPDT
jgi:hypothetical protein